jgi:hypothetical protein
MGLPEGHHKLGDMDVEVVGIKCTIAGTNTLAGAAVDHVTCIKNFRVCAWATAAWVHTLEWNMGVRSAHHATLVMYKNA